MFDSMKAGMWSALFAASLSLLTGCGGGDDTTGVIPSNNETDTATGSGVVVSGQVVAAPSGEWLEGVEIFTQEEGTLGFTDASGRFSFRLPRDSQRTLQLRADGFTPQTYPVSVSGEAHELRFTLREASPVVRIPNAEQGFEYTDPNGARVIIPDSSLFYRDEQGRQQMVTGDVLLRVTPVDISRDNEVRAFPGRFAGTDLNGNPANMILSYGTVNYSFSLPDGTPVNLGTGPAANLATIEIPIYVTKHPDGSDIAVGDMGQAVWSLDESSGLWVQESADGVVVQSELSPTGMALRANVSHFSWWNFDISRDGCETEFDIEGLPEGSMALLSARTVAGGGPRFAEILISADRVAKLYIPKDLEIIIEAEANTRLGLYEARPLQFVGCELTPIGTIKRQLIDFRSGGPKAPIIHSFQVQVMPVMEKVNGQYTVVNNFVHGVFNVSGVVDDPEIGSLELYMRGSDGREMPVAIDRNTFGVHITEDKIFRLVAINNASGNVERVPVTYVDAEPPRVISMRYIYDPVNRGYRLYFNAYGADTINYGYVSATDTNFANPEKMGTVTTERTEDGILIPEPMTTSTPVQLYVEVVNQYGSNVYRLRATNECVDRLDWGLPPYCGLSEGF